MSCTELITQRFYAIKKGCDYCALYENDGNEVRINTRRTYGEFIEYSKMCGISNWQIYHELKPTFKVGDWVECVAKQGQRKLVDYLGGMGCYKTNCGEVISPSEILRKISPFEVIVTIGCLNGTVEKAYGEKKGTFILNGLSGQRNVLWLSMLDAATCVLVESLLKAQDEEK